MYPPQLIPRVVPQRYPFLMIDRIVAHAFKVSATCLKNVTFGEEVLTGHFPENPIYPGVLLIEMGLQTTQVMMTDLEAVISATASSEKSKAVQGYLLSVEKFRFAQPVYPGDVLKVTSELETEAMGMMKAKITITRDQDEIAKGIVMVGEK